MSQLRYLTGTRVGRLSVVGRADDLVQSNGRKRTRWVCSCDCGELLEVLSDNLMKGHTKSCGCLRVDSCAHVGSTNSTHRQTRSKEWWAWTSARQRCINPRSHAYKGYGGRGIKVCPRWVNSFENFYADMGSAPDGMTLERVDVNRDYSPENCVWATQKDQARNKRVTVRVDYLGVTQPLCELAEAHGITRDQAYDRFCRQGWTLERTLNTPIRRRNV